MPKYILGKTLNIEPLIATRDFLSEALTRAENKFWNSRSRSSLWSLLWINLKNFKEST